MIVAADASGLAEAVRLLKAGSVVAIPTETVYGLAADAFNAPACARVFEIKARPHFDPLIVHLANAHWLDRVAKERPFTARLAEAFWPGPLTLVLPRKKNVPGIVTAGLDTVAVRVPAHPVARALLLRADTPLAAPSANRFGGLSPTCAQHVHEGLGADIPLVLDGGLCAVGVESTIVDLSGAQPRLLRPGGLSLEKLEAVLGVPLLRGPAVMDRPQAPGQLASHYAPRTPLRLLPASAAENSGLPRRGLLAYRAPSKPNQYGAVEILSVDGGLETAAARLFECLHRLDALGLDGIDAEPIPADGLGLAINDRLSRAAGGQAN